MLPRRRPTRRPVRRIARPVAAAATALVGIATLAGCSPIVATTAADDANDPLCAAVTVRLPETVQSLEKRETDAQATGAWGDPAQVLLTCGVTVPAASPLPCVYVEGTYWLRDDAQAPTYIFTTFGREPAVDVAITNSDDVAPGVVLADLATAVAVTDKNGLQCSDVEDSLGGDPGGATGTPAPTDSPTGTPTPTGTPAPTDTPAP